MGYPDPSGQIDVPLTDQHRAAITAMLTDKPESMDIVTALWAASSVLIHMREAAPGQSAPSEPLTSALLDEQAAWSRETFGPGDRLDGVLDHIKKEIEDTGQGFIDAWRAKFAKNRSRVWPDWRTAPPGKAIEHDRTADEDPSLLVSEGGEGQ